MCEDRRRTALPMSRRCSSVGRVRPQSGSPEPLEFLRDSQEDLLSTSSGISNFFNEVSPEAHGSLRARPRGILDSPMACDLKPLGSVLRQLSMHLSDHSVSSRFSLEAKSKRNIVALPSDPFKVLDVPGVEDDYYTNLLSWSTHDHIAICLDNTVYLYDYRTAEIDTFYEAYKLEKVTSLAFDPTGTKLAIGNVMGQVAIWDVERKREVLSIDKHLDRVSCLDWTEKGLLSGSRDKRVYLNDIRGRRFTAVKFQAHGQEVCGVKWNCDNSRFASGGNDNRALVWDPAVPAKPLMTCGHKAGVKALCWSHTQRDILVTGGGMADRFIKSWNIAREKLMFSRDTEGQVCALVSSKLTHDVISARGAPDNEIEVWRANGFKKVGNLSGHTERPLYLAWSPAGDVLLSVSSDETMRFWQVYRTQKIAHGCDDGSSLDQHF